VKILVAVKRVIDYQVKIRVNTDESGVETKNVKFSMNPFDEIAVEAAIQLKEAGVAQEVIAVSYGPAECQDTLRQALALGADRALLYQTDNPLEPLAVAKCLQAVVNNESPQLVILGKQAIDDDSNQTGQMLAALLDWPQATFASKIDLQNNKLTVMREVDGGLETIQCELPAVITTDLRLNEPRFPSMPNIMKAKSKPLAIEEISTLNVDVTPRLKIVKISKPPERQSGVKVNSINELISKLHEEEKVL